MSDEKPETGEMKAAPGRPSKLTPEVEAQILEALTGGNYRETAAELAGIDATTFRRWMRRGKKAPRSRFGGFARRVREAERRAEANMLRVVVLGAADDPKHAEWFLEHKFPERWGRRDSIKAELSGSVGITGLADLMAAGHDDEDCDPCEAERDEAKGRAPPEPEDKGKG